MSTAIYDGSPNRVLISSASGKAGMGAGLTP
jgi:hypothetical protein